MPSGRLEIRTAASMATLTLSVCSSVSPSTADSGMPSRSEPSTIVSGDASVGVPWMGFRFAVAEPGDDQVADREHRRARRRARNTTLRRPPAVSIASSTSS